MITSIHITCAVILFTGKVPRGTHIKALVNNLYSHQNRHFAIQDGNQSVEMQYPSLQNYDIMHINGNYMY